MKGKERVRVAMLNGKPDCVPVIPQICIPHAVRVLGLNYEETLLEVVRHPELMNKIVFDCVKYYGVDGLRAWIPSEPMDVIKVDGKWHGQDPKTGQLLGLIDFAGGGSIVPSEEPTLKTDEDIDSIPVVPAEKIIKGGKLDSVKAIIEEAKDDYFVISHPGLFTFEHLTFVRGKIQAMMDIMDNPKFCHKALEKALQVAIQNGLALVSIGIDALLIADTFGGIISPKQFQEFCFPYFKRFVEAMKGQGVLIYMHICGNSRRLFEAIADTGVNCIEPLDPLGGVEVSDAKDRVGHRVALMGGVNTVKLARGSLPEVVADCRRCLNQGAVGGGYILAAGDMLPTETVPEKVKAMVEMAHEHRY
ncbi:MAG: uroporphyrinogen decarboxylase family protein [Candidatus Omnitrophota bacterium]